MKTIININEGGGVADPIRLVGSPIFSFPQRSRATISVVRRGQKTVGVISNTHGLLRPQAVELLRGVERILHAGDIGSPEVLDRLMDVAPVTAIRGNNDTAAWAKKIPATESLRVGAILIYMVHNLKELDIDPSGAGVNVVISGHSHRPSMEWKNKVLFLNPGSAGPRRFKLPISIARLTLDGLDIRAEWIDVSL